MDYLLIIILLFSGCFFIYYVHEKTYKPYVLQNTPKPIGEDFQLTIAISAMKEYSLTRIALNKEESKKRVKEALFHLKRRDSKLYRKVKERVR